MHKKGANIYKRSLSPQLLLLSQNEIKKCIRKIPILINTTTLQIDYEIYVYKYILKSNF